MKLTLYHGSENIIDKPSLDKGKANNDYGRGFYFCKDNELAKEWACKKGNDGYVNKYELELKGLKVLDLQEEKYNVLHWIALLLENRKLTISSSIADVASYYLHMNYLIDVSKYDVIIGYRADDSYFAYAEAFISNSLPLNSLKKSLMLGNLGIQVVLVSNKAFENLKYINSELVDKDIYFSKFYNRDKKARETYKNEIRNVTSLINDIFIMDIIRNGGLNND